MKLQSNVSLRSLYKNKKGLTLVEIIVSIFLIGLLFTSFFTVFYQSGYFAKANEDKLQIANFTRSITNEVEQLTINDLINKNVIQSNLLVGNFDKIITDQTIIQSLIHTNLDNYFVTLELRPGPNENNQSEVSLIEVTVQAKTKNDAKRKASSKTFTYIRWAPETEH